MENRISCMVLEDEERSLNLMINLLNQIPGVDLMGAFMDPEVAIEFLRKNVPDLIFLDIKMPRIDGLQFVERLKLEHLLRPFIFVTAYEEYMLRALRKSAVDYLLKPISLNLLAEAIERFEQNSNDHDISSVTMKLDKLNTELLRFNFKNGFEIVRKSDIIYLKAEGNYTLVTLTGKRELVISQNLGKFTHLLEQKDFVKIHRSVIINLLYFRKLNRINKTCILEYEGHELKTRISSQGIKLLNDYFAST